MAGKCQDCAAYEKADPRGTYTQTINGVTHTHPVCAAQATSA